MTRNSSPIIPAICAAFLRHAALVGLRFSSASNIDNPSSHLSGLDVAIVQTMLEFPQIREPNVSLSQAQKISVVKWTATHYPNARTFSLDNYSKGPGKKLFNYRPIDGQPRIKPVFLCLSKGVICAPLELLQGSNDLSVSSVVPSAHVCFTPAVLHAVWSSIPVPSCQTSSCLQLRYSSPPAIPDSAHSLATVTTSSSSSETLHHVLPSPSTSVLTPLSLSPALAAPHNPATEEVTASTASVASTDPVVGVIPTADPSRLIENFIHQLNQHGQASSTVAERAAVTALAQQVLDNGVRAADPPALPLALTQNMPSTRTSTATVLTPQTLTDERDAPSSFPHLSPLLSPPILMAPLYTETVVGVTRARSQSMEDAASIIAPPATRVRSDSPEVIDIEMSNFSPSPSPSPAPASIDISSDVALVNLLPPAPPKPQLLRKYFERMTTRNREANARVNRGFARIIAQNVGQGAQIVLSIIPYLHARNQGRPSTPPVLPPGCSYSVASLSRLTNPTYRGYMIGDGSGAGPERETVEAALQHLLQNDDIHLIRPLGPTGTFTLDINRFASADDWTRRDRAFTFGFLVFLLVFVIRSFPANVHFSLLFVALKRGSSPHLIWSKELIEQLDPEAAVTLGTWLDVISSSSNISDVVSAMRDQSRPTLQLFLEEYACQQREPVHHLAQRVESRSLSLNEVTETIMGTYLFGGGWPGVMNMQDVRDFSEGFDWHVDPVSSPVKLLNARNSSESISLLTTLTTLYNYRITDPNDILRTISFQSDSNDPAKRCFDNELAYRLFRFFRGRDQPLRPDFSTAGGRALEEAYGGDECARVRRFFHLATGMRQPPPGQFTRIEITLYHTATPPSTRLSVAEASSLQRVHPDFVFKACSTTAQIWVNDYLRNLLKEPFDFGNPGEVTLFDCWAYMQLFGAGGQYTIS